MTAWASTHSTTSRSTLRLTALDRASRQNARMISAISNGDFDHYWAYHLAQEQHRVHQARYPGGVIPIR